ncbi:hypothetical protein [Effusibacillus dendaii]|uniref:Uncharacterized protein n=1 Tax=Effusibacillus dendaii TaxID=2743772 RepID=A0A7I8DCI8_9BACL|nr:hypothetical protein [Effusibacillus dendaii]BCJ86546.1 hypothetical protein skT53_15310 [Effusibacillus dendaii]
MNVSGATGYSAAAIYRQPQVHQAQNAQQQQHAVQNVDPDHDGDIDTGKGPDIDTGKGQKIDYRA